MRHITYPHIIHNFPLVATDFLHHEAVLKVRSEEILTHDDVQIHFTYASIMESLHDLAQLIL